jgi:hypothetical protein
VVPIQPALQQAYQQARQMGDVGGGVAAEQVEENLMTTTAQAGL